MLKVAAVKQFLWLVWDSEQMNMYKKWCTNFYSKKPSSLMFVNRG